MKSQQCWPAFQDLEQAGIGDTSARLSIEKSRGPKASALSWLVARIKLLSLVQLCGERARHRDKYFQIVLPPVEFRGALYAVRRGRSVRSLTWATMLDICIALSWATNGRISAINWSCVRSRISS